MTKIVGAVMLFAAAIGYGLIKIREERRKIAETDALADFVKFIRDNIAHYMKPLPDIFSAYESTSNEVMRFVGDCTEVGIRSAWERTELGLSDKTRRIMQDFSSSIGGGYREDELELCDYTIEQLDAHRSVMREELAGKEKMYRTIPALLALSVVLIFV